MLPFGLNYVQFALGAVGVLILFCLVAFAFGSFSPSTANRGGVLDGERRSSRNWARFRNVRELQAPKEPDPNRLRLCQIEGKMLANPTLRSKMVIAPSGAGKTPRVVVPDVICHHGPAVVTSIKSDVLRLTRFSRESMGKIFIFDPAESVGPTARWSPLAHIKNWADALDAARSIQECNKADGAGIKDREFWDAQARYLLAPLIFLAAKKDRTMADVAALVVGGNDIQARVSQELQNLGETGAILYWSRFVGLAQETISSVLITAATVLEPWTHPKVANAVNVRASDSEALNLDELLQGNNTLYLVSPATDQQMFTPIYEAMINALTHRVEQVYHASGFPLDPPLLLALDEAANIAPLRKLDYLASAGAGQGILVLSVWQDEGQLEERYGQAKARTIRANHYATIYMPGISDHGTLKNLSDQIGDDHFARKSTSTGESGTSVTSSLETLAVAPPSWLRQLGRNEVVAIAGHFKPILGTLPAWYEDKKLRALIDPGVAEEFDKKFGSQQKKKGKSKR